MDVSGPHFKELQCDRIFDLPLYITSQTIILVRVLMIMNTRITCVAKIKH